MVSRPWKNFFVQLYSFVCFSVTLVVAGHSTRLLPSYIRVSLSSPSCLLRGRVGRMS
jgi:hypothetical protein